MTEESRKYAKDRMEYFREFHRVIAPVVVRKMDRNEDTINKISTEINDGNNDPTEQKKLLQLPSDGDKSCS